MKDFTFVTKLELGGGVEVPFTVNVRASIATDEQIKSAIQHSTGIQLRAYLKGKMTQKKGEKWVTSQIKDKTFDWPIVLAAPVDKEAIVREYMLARGYTESQITDFIAHPELILAPKVEAETKTETKTKTK